MIAFLVESAVRAVAFAGVIGLVLQVARVRNVATRLAAWTCVLYGALLLPLAVPFLPALPVPVLHREVSRKLVVLPAVEAPAPVSRVAAVAPQSRFDWETASMALYLIIAAGLLGRLGFGWMVARRLRGSTRLVADSQALALLDVQTRAVGIGKAPELVESGGLAVPITVGWLRPSIILPDNWREWAEAKLAAVLAHELSHVARGDYGTLFLASVYRCIFWFHPLSWWLDRQLRELAEQASDDSALHGAVDRTQYAEVLLSFFEALQGERGRARWQGVAMARGRRAEHRIDRILANRILSTPARWPVMAGLTLVCVPLLYVSGALQPVLAQAAPVPPPPPPPAPVAQVANPEAPLPPPPPPPQWSHDKGLEGYVIVTGDTTTMSGSTDDLRRATAMHGRISGDYIWFRRDGKAFVIRDAGILKAAAKLLEPQHELGRQQGELGDQQSKLGELQAELGEKQSRVRTTPADLKREIEELKEKLRSAGSADELGDVQALLAELQTKIGDKQSHIGDQQAKLGEEQARLGQQQAELGEKQAKLGEEQARRAEEAHRELRKLFDEAFKKGLVEPEPR